MVELFISLDGQTNAALEFYENVFGCKVKSVTLFSEMPINPSLTVPENMKDWIAYAEMTICGTVFHFTDVQKTAMPGDMVSLMIRYKTIDEITDVYHKLSDGGEVLTELAPAVNAKTFACVKDRFGIGWQLICE